MNCAPTFSGAIRRPPRRIRGRVRADELAVCAINRPLRWRIRGTCVGAQLIAPAWLACYIRLCWPERSWNGEHLLVIPLRLSFLSTCHPEQSEGSYAMGSEILRFAQDDKGADSSLQ